MNVNKTSDFRKPESTIKVELQQNLQLSVVSKGKQKIKEPLRCLYKWIVGILKTSLRDLWEYYS